ncbi:hypothetical protein MTO96_011121 [Rhipicephalus appendiculatus]
MESQPLARVQVPPTNRDGTYVVIVLLGVSIVIGTFLLTYSLNGYGMLKWNTGIRQRQVAAFLRANAAIDSQRVQDNDTETTDALWANGNRSSMPAALSNETSVGEEALRDAASWRDAISRVQDDAGSATSTLTTPQAVYGKDVLDPQQVSAFQVRDGKVSSAAAASTAPEAATEMVHYPISARKARDSNTAINGLVEAT